MHEDERFQKLKVAMEDEEFEKKVADCNSAKALYELMESENIGYSEQEVEDIYNVIKNSGDGELTEESLDDVTGGFGVVAAVGVAAGCYIAGRLYGTYGRKQINKMLHR